MKYSKTIKEYYYRIKEVVNQLTTHGEAISGQRVIEKILIFITENFDTIATSIEQPSWLDP